MPTPKAAPPKEVASERRAEATASTTARALTKPELIAPLTLASERRLTLLDKAYLDAFSILRDDNTCSRFYGGPAAIEALNTLTLQLRPAFLDRTIALRMTGRISYITDYASGYSYRAFEKAELNQDGPFYTATVVPNPLRVLGVGEFFPNTREARVTILLHELGHMVLKGDTQWVLPDDGGETTLSQQNTARVLAACREQITRLSKTSFAQELLSARALVKPDPVSRELAGVAAPPPVVQ